MKNKLKIAGITAVIMLFFTTGCDDVLHEPLENQPKTNQTDYRKTEDMIKYLVGAYANFYKNTINWNSLSIIAIRGDDVNKGGGSDQSELGNFDSFVYNDFWMLGGAWQSLYNMVFVAQAAMEQILLYREHATNKAPADQYIGEIKVLRAWTLLQLSNIWGSIVLPTSHEPSAILGFQPVPKREVVAFINQDLDEIISTLPALNPNERGDLKGGVTKYTALAVKAFANLEVKNYAEVAKATSEIISSEKFSLEPSFYDLFKLKGKLNKENLLELQYSVLGKAGGNSYWFNSSDFFGPQEWKPKVTGAGGGWGFWEPSLKYIKFMLDRGETERLETTVIFTPAGISTIRSDSKYSSTFPPWISNITRSGDEFVNYDRAKFVSGKYYLPSDQMVTGWLSWIAGKNLPVIRYAEILLIHAEARTQGGSGSLSALEAVNRVRNRAKMPSLSSVTVDDVLDEKYAELATEWGSRFYDMLRYQKYGELSYDGRTFTENKKYVPYPQSQKDKLTILKTIAQE